jgi:hypothetical protein
MPVSRAKKLFTITEIPGCGPNEVVFARKRFTVRDQEEINNQLLAMSLDAAKDGNPSVDMQTNFGAIKRATLSQMIESWTLQEEVELPGGQTMVAPLPQIKEDPDVVNELDIEVADYIFMAIQTKRNPAETPEQQESFLANATEATSAS